jgi:hypothetical protein
MDFDKELKDIPDLIKNLSDKGFSKDDMSKYISMIKNGNNTQLLNEMSKKGMDIKDIKNKAKSFKKLLYNSKKLLNGNNRTVAIITSGRKLKIKTINCNPKDLLLCDEAIEINCSRLSDDIKIYYDPHDKRNNRRATKLIGYKIGGDLVIASSKDITSNFIIDIEKSFI